MWDRIGVGSIDEKVNVIVLGTRQMGSGMITLLLHKHGFGRVGVYGWRAYCVGADIGKALGRNTVIGVKITMMCLAY